ncbi:hypothetical protein CRG98_010294 [Punica granatum]|uniref:Uncharacterized protein n=1 Tax=Punica granatum TaxID=22663 RepID=A0A2I0KM18_PUNGR|nr:hypothetical protein CRG98_010294 [Punica granatum]
MGLSLCRPKWEFYIVSERVILLHTHVGSHHVIFGFKADKSVPHVNRAQEWPGYGLDSLFKAKNHSLHDLASRVSLALAAQGNTFLYFDNDSNSVAWDNNSVAWIASVKANSGFLIASFSILDHLKREE